MLIHNRFAAFSLSLLLSAAPAAVIGQTTLLDLSNGLTGLTTAGGVEVLDAADHLVIEGNDYTLTPAAGQNMLKITPSGSEFTPANGADAALGLTAGTLTSIVGPSVTNVGFAQDTFTLASGSYSFAWAYAAQDYQPYNDGVFISIVGADGQNLVVLARNGVDELDVSGPSPVTQIMGSYGSTDWNTTTFDIVTGGDYVISFGAFNWDDDVADPILYVAATAGSFDGVAVTTTSAVPEASSYAMLAGIPCLAIAAIRRRRNAA